jgi:hypothetical protein
LKSENETVFSSSKRDQKEKGKKKERKGCFLRMGGSLPHTGLIEIQLETSFWVTIWQ